VPPGIYNEQLVVDKPLTLIGPDPALGDAVVDSGGMAAVPTIHILSGNVTITRLTLQNGPLHGIQAGSAAFPNLSNIIIKNNTIRGHDRAGILTNHGAAMHIEGNQIENNGQGTGFNRVGIVLYPHGPSSVLSNTIKNNVVDGIFARASSSGLLIENNDIENHLNSGITLAWDERNVTIRGNRITGAGSGTSDETGGIVIIQSMAEEISGNTVRDCNRSGIFWGWVPSVGPPPAQILITGNTIEDSARDAIYLFSMGPGGFIPPDPFPLEPLVQGNTLKGSIRAGVYVSNLYYASPGNANPRIHSNNIEENSWGVFNATAKTVDATENWWGSTTGPFHPTLNPDGLGNPVSDNVAFVPWLDHPAFMCTDPYNNCKECCNVFTSAGLRQLFGYQEITASCQCHDICVPDVQLICVGEKTHELLLPLSNLEPGCRDGETAQQLSVVCDGVLVRCAQAQLNQACDGVEVHVGLGAVLRINRNGNTMLYIVDTTVEFTCSAFYSFPDGLEVSGEALASRLKRIDGFCATVIAGNCWAVNADAPRVEIDLTVINKMWKHENLLVSVLAPYPGNVTLSRAFEGGHGICP